MLVILHFHQLGYKPLEIALLFLFYEFFGIVTNLTGGWLGARIGLNRTMNIGLFLQICALGMLAVDSGLLTVPYVMLAQAVSGIAKDLNKMSAKSSVKMLKPGKEQRGGLYKWVAFLTGSKNALKGAGFFIGALLLTVYGFSKAMLIMAGVLVLVLIISLLFLGKDVGAVKFKPKFREMFSKSSSINILSSARFFLFGSRDVWFVIALPVFLEVTLNWKHESVGVFMAVWVIFYGIVQGVAPVITGIKRGAIPDGRTAALWVGILALIPLGIYLGLNNSFDPQIILVSGLLVFGFVFAVNSSVHSYLVLDYAGKDGVSLDVGFYYMANAGGRLTGTIISGLFYQLWGLGSCLLVSALFLLLSFGAAMKLPSGKDN